MKRFEKGSEEARAYMASIREKRKVSDMPKKEKKVVPARARMEKGSEDAKEKMAKLREAKMAKKESK
jgi:hypothetical protein